MRVLIGLIIHIMAFQRDQLKKGYRIKTTQRRARLMRQIRRTPKHALREIHKAIKHTKKKRAINYGYTQYDTTRAYVNKTITCDQTHLCVGHSKAEAGEVYLQCMNAFKSPTRKKKQKHRHVKTSPSTQQTRSHHKFSPITIPGTPESTDSTVTSIFQSSTEDLKSKDTPNKDKPTQSRDDETDDELEDINLY